MTFNLFVFRIHLTIEEKVSATANRDGGLQNLEVNGVMLLKVNDPESAKIAVQLNLSADANIFKVLLIDFLIKHNSLPRPIQK